MSGDHPRPKGRVYLYPMGGPGGRNSFTNGTFADLEAEGITPVPGMRLRFYSDDGNDKGEPDYLLFNGVINRDPLSGVWYAVVDDDLYWHESDEREEEASSPGPVQWVREPEGPLKSFRCPCCKFRTLRGRGHYEICPVCFWEDDGQDEADADRVLGGPNYTLSLRQAQVNFRRIGAVEDRFLSNVRPPLPDEV